MCKRQVSFVVLSPLASNLSNLYIFFYKKKYIRKHEKIPLFDNSFFIALCMW